MKDGKYPNPNTIHPIAGYDKEIYVKPTITNPNIMVGEFTYILQIPNLKTMCPICIHGMRISSSSGSSVRSPLGLNL